MLVFVKLGGSLITDKQRESTFLPQAMSQIAAEIAQALSASPDLRLVIGHGSGSFGHFAARTHGTARGVTSPEGWRGFAAVAAAARELNHLVLHSLRDAGVPAMAFQPSAALMSDHRKIVYYETAPITAALEHRLVPVVHGDVAFDKAQGGAIISTETVFFYLAQHLPAQQIVCRVDDDPVEPGGEAGITLERVEVPESFDEGFLGDVGRIPRIAEGAQS